MLFLSDEQTICWKCEEGIHPAALFCPYCNADVKKHVATRTPEEPHPIPLVVEAAPHGESAKKMTFFPVVVFFMLMGSALFFLAICIRLLAQDGSLTISWQEKNWISFLALGVSLMAFGGYLLQQET